MAAYFLVAGAFRIFASLSTRYEHWGWSLLNGVVTFALGILIWAWWPGSALWVLGVFIGIDLIFSGWTLISISLIARQAPGAPPPVPPTAPAM
jgi:uncharacterized membrane protein HdeD (DUF308 family)